MKRINTLLIMVLLAFASLNLVSQTFEIKDYPQTISGSTDDYELNLYMTIVNKTSEPLQIRVTIDFPQLTNGHSAGYCIGDPTSGGICYPPTTIRFEGSKILNIPANGSSKKVDFKGQFFPNEVKGVSVVNFEVIDVANSNNKASISTTFTIGTLGLDSESSLNYTISNESGSDIVTIAGVDINKLQLFDITGNLVVNTTSNFINTSSLPIGKYFLKVNDFKATEIIVNR